jgi:hypothetical protein
MASCLRPWSTPRVLKEARALRGRPRLDLAVFWTLPEPGPPTRPRGATYHGWFYPVHDGRPAVIDMLVNAVRVPRRAPARALAILARNGVPTRSAGVLPDPAYRGLESSQCHNSTPWGS